MDLPDLLPLTARLGVSAFALTDINSTTGVLDFVRRAKNSGVKPVVGVDFRVGAKQKFIVLACDNFGYYHLNQFLTAVLHRTIELKDRPPELLSCIVIYPFADLEFAHSLGPNEFIGIKRPEQLQFQNWKPYEEKLLAVHTASFCSKMDYNIHRLLRAIDNNTLLSKLSVDEQGIESDCFISEMELKQKFKGYEPLLRNTQRVLDSCSIDFESTIPKNQRVYSGNEELDKRLLRKLCNEALEYRYQELNEVIRDRLEKELSLISEKGFVCYFLINWKIVKYAISKGYPYVGRGSGANSIVAYLLRITDVDPVELDLYFERFMNLYRHNPPDFDIDFSWSDRDDVIHYIFMRFEHTALIAVYNTFKRKAAIRELGKVFGLPKHEIDRLSVGGGSVYGDNKLSGLVLKYAKLIEGFPNYLGIHAGGIVIADRPIEAFSATFMPPKGLATTQFDMVVAEDVGLYKFDILSQRGLGKIKDAVELIAENHSELAPIDIHDIPKFKEDKRIKYLLKHAKAIGCFYVESPAMRMLLRKLETDTYLGLVAASSVIRPGVANSGMMREYILRFRNPERREDAHQVLLDIMPDTYGVMVYQEDVIKVAHFFAGLTLGEADMLRRGMSGKYRSREEFLKVKGRYFQNCENRGHSLELSTEIWRQIESFAGYAFAKGHSASYAVESYQCLYLKAYYPLEFMVAILNNFGGFYSVESYVQEARLHGGVINAPCVNKGGQLTRIEGVDVYLGFILVKGLESNVVRRIVKDRDQRGIFCSFEDFLNRVPIALEQLVMLVRIDAFRFTGRSKRLLLWEAYRIANHKLTAQDFMNDLFKKGGLKEFKMPELLSSTEEDAFDCMEYLGFPLISPFELLDIVDRRKYCLAEELAGKIGKEVWVEGYMVTVKKVKVSSGGSMYFGNFLDRDGGFLDTVHFPQIAMKYPFRGRGVYAIKGIVKEEFGCITIETLSMEKLPVIEDPRYSEKQLEMKVSTDVRENLSRYKTRKQSPVSNELLRKKSV